MMHKFIKLTSCVINTHHITKIISNNDKHYIYMRKNIGGIFSVVFGIINSDDDIIEVCKNKHNEEYKTISNFIDNINND